MIKKIIAVFLTLVFLLIKKIFIRKNRTPHKIMDALSNKLHSLFVFTSFIGIYLSLLEIEIGSYSLSTIIYLLLFLQVVIIIRYFNPKLLQEKPLQIKITKSITKVNLIFFILHWIFISFGFAVGFLFIVLFNNGFYIFIINQVNRQKEQEEFKKQFGDGDFSQKNIIKTHIQNLFEEDRNFDELTKSDIKKQYRLMAKKYHPDVYEGSDDRFVSINSSYTYLLDLKSK